jgi:hypothetical protein
VQPTTAASTAAALPTSRPPIRSPRALLISTAAGYRLTPLLGALREIHRPPDFDYSSVRAQVRHDRGQRVQNLHQLLRS